MNRSESNWKRIDSRVKGTTRKNQLYWKIENLSLSDCRSWINSSNNRVTVTIWIPDKSAIQMVQTSLVVKWSSFWLVGWKPDKNVSLMVWMVRLVTWSNNLKTGQKSVWKVECSEFMCLVFRWLLFTTKYVTQIKDY